MTDDKDVILQFTKGGTKRKRTDSLDSIFSPYTSFMPQALVETIDTIAHDVKELKCNRKILSFCNENRTSGTVYNPEFILDPPIPGLVSYRVMVINATIAPAITDQLFYITCPDLAGRKDNARLNGNVELDVLHACVNDGTGIYIYEGERLDTKERLVTPATISKIRFGIYGEDGAEKTTWTGKFSISLLLKYEIGN